MNHSLLAAPEMSAHALLSTQAHHLQLTSNQNEVSTMASPSPSYSHLLAQQMNNSAALCIEAGDYAGAIASLKKALEINKDKKHNEKVCKCHNCTLDGCIAVSENDTSPDAYFSPSSTVADDTRARKRIKKTPSIPKTRRETFWKPQHSDSNYTRPKRKQEKEKIEEHIDCGYIYQQPIRIGCIGHDMGSTLFLIIIFNLALAHHLEAVRNGHPKKKRDKIIDKTLSLYELTYKWQLKLLCRDKSDEEMEADPTPAPSCSSVTSIRFNMIIRNNLSQIHRLTKDYSKYKRCLQYLLSTVMVVVEYRSRNYNSQVDSSTPSKDPRIMNLDGFLHNTAAIMLEEDHCAHVA